MPKIEEETQAEKRNKSKWLRWAGLIVGLLGAGIATVTYWGFTQEVLGPFAIVIPILVLGVILFLAWKKPFIGGILLIGASLPVALFGLPLLAAGILFLLSWIEGRKYPEQSTRIPAKCLRLNQSGKRGVGLCATGRGVSKRQLVIGWMAVTMSVLAASFFGIFAGREGVTEGWSTGLSHLVPMLVIILGTLVAIRWPRVGGSILVWAGLCFFFSWFLVLPYSVAFFIVAGLPWFFGQPSPRRLAYALVGALPVMVGAVTALLAASTSGG